MAPAGPVEVHEVVVVLLDAADPQPRAELGADVTAVGSALKPAREADRLVHPPTVLGAELQQEPVGHLDGQIAEATGSAATTTGLPRHCHATTTSIAKRLWE
jgi:hypothetical protein